METAHASWLASSKSQEISNLLSQLPKQTWFEDYELYQWQGSWYSPFHLEGTFAAQKLFEARDEDIILASSVKSGTTWLKSVVPCLINCPLGDNDDPLTEKNPHHVVSTIEGQMYENNLAISTLPSPRILHTHLPYNALPDSIKISNCKIVYIARDPRDAFVSLWHFMNKIRTQERGLFSIDKAFDSFCNGVQLFGPSFDHVLEYWNKSLVFSNKILFLKYEEMKRNPKEQVLKLASFLGKSFANDEEIDNVLWRSSFERLKNLEVNKNGNVGPTVKNSAFFRLGTTGDWKNYFTQDMEERLDRIIRMKYEGSGLNLEI